MIQNLRPITLLRCLFDCQTSEGLLQSSIVHMLHNSTQVSQEIAELILNRAKQLHLHHRKNIALDMLSQQAASKYPTECTSTIVQFEGLIPSIARSERFTHSYNQPPLSPTYQRPVHQHTALQAIVPLKKNRSSKFLKKSQSRGSHQPFKNRIQCLKLDFQDEDDEEIEAMRQKKQRLYELQAIFIESENKERAKPKIKRTKQTFTTDFNGQNLEMSTVKKKPNVDSYFRSDVHFTIRQEREENHRLPTQESYRVKPQLSKRSSNRIGVLLSKRVLPKQSAPREIDQNLTMKDIQGNKNLKQEKSSRYIKNFPSISEAV